MITLTLSELAELCGATLEGEGDRRIVGPAALAEAEPDEVSFLGNPRYAAELESTRAGAVLVAPQIESKRRDLPLLRCTNPNQAFTRVIEAFRPPDVRPPAGVHPTAVLGEGVRLGTDVSVGAHCVVGAGSTLDDGAVLHPGVFVGNGVRVGARSVLFSACVLYHRVLVGSDCVIHSGAVIGADGFGFDPTPEGWRKVPQCGTVVIEDDVEIGANTTIDRGRFGATRIGAGAKLDNLVHVAHNVVIGPGALLIAQVGIAGSSRIGARAILAGQVGVVGHVEVGPGARISAQSGVTKDLPGGKDYFGSPVLPQVEALRRLASMNKLPELARRVRELEERLARLEGEG